MTHASLTIILHEHRALSAMLRSIVLLLDDHRRRGTLPDFAALRAMLFYVDEFPEKLHHPKESLLLFPKLRGHSAHSDAVLDRLDRDHARGEHAIRELEHALLGFEMMGEAEPHEHAGLPSAPTTPVPGLGGIPECAASSLSDEPDAPEAPHAPHESRRATFETAMHLYVRFYLEHMHIEETEVLPLAEARLGAADWAELDRAFLTNRDPLAGFDAVAAYQPLFKKILAALPGSGGVASVLEALSGAGPPKFGGLP